MLSRGLHAWSDSVDAPFEDEVPCWLQYSISLIRLSDASYSVLLQHSYQSLGCNRCLPCPLLKTYELHADLQKPSSPLSGTARSLSLVESHGVE